MMLLSPPIHSSHQPSGKPPLIWKNNGMWARKQRKEFWDISRKKPWVWLLSRGAGQNIVLDSKSLWLLKTNNKQTNHFRPLSHSTKGHALEAVLPQGLLTLEICPVEAPLKEGSQDHGEQWSWEEPGPNQRTFPIPGMEVLHNACPAAFHLRHKPRISESRMAHFPKRNLYYSFLPLFHYCLLDVCVWGGITNTVFLVCHLLAHEEPHPFLATQVVYVLRPPCSSTWPCDWVLVDGIRAGVQSVSSELALE